MSVITTIKVVMEGIGKDLFSNGFKMVDAVDDNRLKKW